MLMMMKEKKKKKKLAIFNCYRDRKYNLPFCVYTILLNVSMLPKLPPQHFLSDLIWPKGQD